jgi:REP element-mobilizing transposase RayT
MPQSLVQIYAHLIFSTKDREPFLSDPAFRERTHAYLHGICEHQGSPSLIVGGAADHVHILCRLSKTLKAANLSGLVLTTAVSNTHIHMLIKVPDREARKWIGLAKKHAWFEMRDAGWQAKLWAKRGKIQPIHNRKHQQNCFAYILRHIHEDAWVWVSDCIADDVIDRIISQG